MDTEAVDRRDDRATAAGVAGAPDATTARMRHRAVPRQPPADVHAWTPRLDVFETPRGIMVLVDVPGVRDDDVEIWLDVDDLIVDGQRHVLDAVADAAYCRREREHGRFYRRLALPIRATAEDAIAHLVDGVLAIELPRSIGERRRPHRIVIAPSAQEELAEREREQAALLDDEAWQPALD